MKWILCLSALFVLVTFSSAANILCYFSSWSTYRPGNGKFVPENVDPQLCTHVLYSFVGLNADGSVRILDEWEAINLNGFSGLVDLKQQNENLKILVSMGGWNEVSAIYSQVAANPTKRKLFVRNVVNFLEQYGFDGFDLSWEYPGSRGGGPADKKNFVLLLQELKSAMGALVLSIGAAGLVSQIDISYDVASISKTVDMINVMSYDFHGAYENYVGHASALYASSLDKLPLQKKLNVNASMHHWLDKGADPSKLNLAIVTYGRGFTLADPTKTNLYDPTVATSAPGPYTQQDGMMGYNEICEFDSDWEYVFDDEQKVPHIVYDDQWIGFEDVTSVAAKAQFAKDLQLGGVSIWSIDTDDFNGICGADIYPLINKVKSILQ